MIRWVIQKNLGNLADVETMRQACEANGIACELVDVIPFSDELPNIPADMPTVFYGSARFVHNTVLSKRWSPCAFFDDSEFRFSKMLDAYGNHMLNNDAFFGTMRELAESQRADDEVVFIRPDRDLKEFAGQLLSMKEYREWFDRIDCPEKDMTIAPETVIIAAPPQTIKYEWRLFMVDGKLCTGSRYRHYGELKVSPDIPENVKAFAEGCAAEFSPAQVFVMDIAEANGQLKIIEINGFNSSGFYAADIGKIITEVSDLVEGTHRK